MGQAWDTLDGFENVCMGGTIGYGSRETNDNADGTQTFKDKVGGHARIRLTHLISGMAVGIPGAGTYKYGCTPSIL